MNKKEYKEYLIETIENLTIDMKNFTLDKEYEAYNGSKETFNNAIKNIVAFDSKTKKVLLRVITYMDFKNILTPILFLDLGVMGAEGVYKLNEKLKGL